MKRDWQTISLFGLAAIFLVALVGVGGVAWYQHEQGREMRERLEAMKVEQARLSVYLDQQSQQLILMQEDINQAHQRIRAERGEGLSEGKLGGMAGQTEGEQRVEQEVEKLDQARSEVIAPIYHVVYGKQTPVFPGLKGRSGEVVMVDAEYRETVGRTLYFKNGEGYRNFDVLELHPGVLAHLKVSESELILNQQAIEERSKANRELRNQYLVQKEQLDRQRQDHQAKIEIQSAEAWRSQALAVEAEAEARRHQMEGAAALRTARAREVMADAAVIRALRDDRPTQYYNTVQQTLIPPREASGNGRKHER